MAATEGGLERLHKLIQAIPKGQKTPECMHILLYHSRKGYASQKCGRTVDVQTCPNKSPAPDAFLAPDSSHSHAVRHILTASGA